jgi:hypothetical protein
MLAGVPPYQAENTGKLESLIRSRRSPRALPSTCPAPLRAIVSKSLAPEPERRYRTAAAFQADLQAYLEHEPTSAEMERRAKWSAGATLEAARDALRRITRTAQKMRRRGRRLKIAGAFAWFGAGMALWIGGSILWQSAHARTIAATVRMVPPKPDLDHWYVAAANNIIEAYSHAPLPYLSEFDWHKAEICLEGAIALGTKDDRTLGLLALARGYATLERLGGNEYSPAAAAQLRIQARNAFLTAAQKRPDDPRPHLALARVYVYSLPNADAAMKEFAAAERLGATLGRREIEEQGDAFRIRATREARSNPRQARRDADTARTYYRQVSGFDQADAHLRELPQLVAAQSRRRSRWP